MNVVRTHMKVNSCQFEHQAGPRYSPSFHSTQVLPFYSCPILRLFDASYVMELDECFISNIVVPQALLLLPQTKEGSPSV